METNKGKHFNFELIAIVVLGYGNGHWQQSCEMFKSRSWTLSLFQPNFPVDAQFSRWDFYFFVWRKHFPDAEFSLFGRTDQMFIFPQRVLAESSCEKWAQSAIRRSFCNQETGKRIFHRLNYAWVCKKANEEKANTFLKFASAWRSLKKERCADKNNRWISSADSLNSRWIEINHCMVNVCVISWHNKNNICEMWMASKLIHL